MRERARARLHDLKIANVARQDKLALERQEPSDIAQPTRRLMLLNHFANPSCNQLF